MQYTKEYVNDKVQTDDRWLERAIVAIWKFQTKNEQVEETTKLNNGVGFNGVDGHFMTSLGNWLNKRPGNHLSEKQKYRARIKMRKYTGQLLRIIDAKNE